VLCKITELSRTQIYIHKKNPDIKPVGRPPPGYTINRDGKTIEDSVILERLKFYRTQIEFINGGGVRKLSKYLVIDYGMYINHKKIYRICRDKNLLLFREFDSRSRPKKKRCGDHDVTGPNQLWQFDLKYIWIHGENRWCFVLAFIDVFSKKVINYFLGLSVKSGDLILTLNQALMKESITTEHGLMIRSDNGPQMSSNKFHFYLKRLEQKLKHEFIPPRTPNRNAYIESFFSILEAEFIVPRYFYTYADVYAGVDQFIVFYNTRRIHGSIGYKSPKQFLDDYGNGLIPPIKISA
jgi:putative transposase